MKKNQSTIPVLFGLLFGAILFYNIAYSQTATNVLPQHKIFLGHDLATLLFGKTKKEPDIRNATITSFFIPVAGYEYSLNKHWWLGVKVGFRRVNEREQIVKVTNPSVIDTLTVSIKESSAAFNLYSKYVFRPSNRLNPYAGAGFGYRWNKEIDGNSFVTGQQQYKERKYGEFAFLIKAGVMYRVNKQVGFFTEGEYRDMLSLWCAGITIIISK